MHKAIFIFKNVGTCDASFASFGMGACNVELAMAYLAACNPGLVKFDPLYDLT